METRNPNSNQGGRNEPRPGSDDDDAGTDPRRTREGENDRDIRKPRPNQPGQNPGNPRPDQTPRVG